MPPTIEPPDDFSELESWRNASDSSPGRDLVNDWMATWETGWIVDEAGLRPFDDWERVTVDCSTENEWSVTITYEDGTSETLELGRDGWHMAWDIFDIADSDANDVEAERGDIDYSG